MHSGNKAPRLREGRRQRKRQLYADKERKENVGNFGFTEEKINEYAEALTTENTEKHSIGISPRAWLAGNRGKCSR